jgi:hypothetical protein
VGGNIMLKLYVAVHRDAENSKEVSDKWLKEHDIIRPEDVIDISGEPYYNAACINAKEANKPVVCLDMNSAQWQISYDYSKEKPCWNDIDEIERGIKNIETGDEICCLQDCENEEDEAFFKAHEKEIGTIGWY